MTMNTNTIEPVKGKKHREFLNENTDFEVRSMDTMCVNESELKHPIWHNLKYMVAGILFGIILVKAEVISWFRIQEMFRLQSFHMYGVIGSAVAVGVISVFLISKKINKGNIIGGLIFGFGWALTGACPGPLFAQIGMGTTVIIVTLFSAIAGTWVYGYLREKLPH